jgi:hypothetical protein
MSEGAQSGWLARNYGRIASLSFAVAIIGVLVGLSAGVLYRLDLVPLMTSLFTLLPAGAYISAAGAALCLLSIVIALILYKGEFLAKSALPVVGLIAGGIAVYIPYGQQQLGASVPPIHDISTDTSDPPVFVDILPLREADNAPNTAEYLVEYETRGRVLNVPEVQKEGYPDIQSSELWGLSFYEGFDLALAAAKQQGWTIVAADKEEGRIEAWDKTTFMGFVDDVVIRIRPEGIGSIVDIRSVSRVGGSDVGKNAQRIRTYVKTLKGMQG